MTWDDRWIGLASYVAEWSKDRSRKNGAVIVDNRQSVVSLGWNGFPRGIDDDVPERHIRPYKYLWTEHAERNALYNGVAIGAPALGCRVYTTLYPCADCARAIIQSGIVEVICPEPNWDDDTYAHSFAVTKLMLEEAGVRVSFYEKQECLPFTK